MREAGWVDAPVWGNLSTAYPSSRWRAYNLDRFIDEFDIEVSDVPVPDSLSQETYETNRAQFIEAHPR